MSIKMRLSILQKLKTYMRLGLRSVAVVALYRAACKSGYFRRLQPVQEWENTSSIYFKIPLCAEKLHTSTRSESIERADILIDGRCCHFSRHENRLGNPPDWFLDPFSGARIKTDDHWSSVNEFGAGDIKVVWEASRFDWVVTFSQAYLVSQDERYLSALNEWLNDWLAHNPINAGTNWKCGQEASIRIMNLAMAARLLDQVSEPNAALLNLVRVHLQRIAPTLRYAMAQDNNHGTSEAAALFIGGSWLEQSAPDADSRKWLRQGLYWLENRVDCLIEQDGSFSQYSVNYHRVVLDTLSMVEVWRQGLNLPAFSRLFQDRCQAATLWLYALVAQGTGDAPNLGANDGARLLSLGVSTYRDYRPSVQLASLLFCEERAYPKGGWDAPAELLGHSALSENLLPTSGSKVYPDGGYALLKQSDSFGVARFANFRFRPSHADCLHFDLWHHGINILRDGGTFSYNTDAELIDYFSGTASHNTVQFDGRNQMPRISRFLFGEWLQMEEVSEIQQVDGRLTWSGAYTDGEGASHRRTIDAEGDRWLVKDKISGFRDKAVLRWRLAPGEWALDGFTCMGELASLSVESSAPVKRMELVTGWESRYYLEKTELHVLEIEVGVGAAVITTEIILKKLVIPEDVIGNPDF